MLQFNCSHKPQHVERKMFARPILTHDNAV
uniref:Uncharacterized protein n=1 Tax=Arundo donax TaxID=35708 RepID=A0A0A9FNT6_ARUDO